MTRAAGGAIMSEGAALFQAICENPFDDGLRLVYADWLEEHGDPDRADFIRLQVELARLPRESPRAQEIHALQQPLLSRHFQEWFGALPRLSGVNWLSFMRRGFVCQAHIMHFKFYRAHADTIFAATPLQYLRIDGVSSGACRELALSPYLARLHTLDLDGNVLTDEGVRALAESPHLANLRLLGLAGRWRHSVPPLLVPSFGNAGALALAGSPYLAGLERLHIRNNPLGDEAVEALRRRFGDRLTIGGRGP
jgi:uncharacterized protein (TIGR02996 family)